MSQLTNAKKDQKPVSGRLRSSSFCRVLVFFSRQRVLLPVSTYSNAFHN